MNINLIAEKLQKRYPQSTPNEDWRIVVNTSGAVSLAEWKLPVPKPTLEEVDSQYTDEEILASRPGRETSLTKNPNTNAILKVIAELTNTPYNTVVKKLKTILDAGP
jgi:hypothetical protein